MRLESRKFFYYTISHRLGRPLTLSEKIVYGHLDDAASQVGNFCYDLDSNHCNLRTWFVENPIFV